MTVIPKIVDITPAHAPRRKRRPWAALVVTVVLALGVGALVSWMTTPPSSPISPGEEALIAGSEDPATEDATFESNAGGAPDRPGGSASSSHPVLVHIGGAVVRPGVVSLAKGARVFDAVAAAGGFTTQADLAQMNLARAVNDGESILVPAQGKPGAASHSAAGSSTSTGATSGSGSNAGAPSGPVNLNTADQKLLESLPHVGPALAARIIEWRESHGGFASVNQLREVSGIGEKTFADLKPLVTV